jgi:hypothetical protein
MSTPKPNPREQAHQRRVRAALASAHAKGNRVVVGLTADLAPAEKLVKIASVLGVDPTDIVGVIDAFLDLVRAPEPQRQSRATDVARAARNVALRELAAVRKRGAR